MTPSTFRTMPLHKLAGPLLALATILAPGAAGAENSATRPEGSYGVLVLSHGGAPEWNATIEAAVQPLRARWPVEIAFGMADAASTEAAARRLEAAGVRRIGVVRLFVWGESFLVRTRQMLGLDPGAPPRPAGDAPPPVDHAHMHGAAAGDRLLGHQELKAHWDAISFWRIESAAVFAVGTEGLAQSPAMGEVLAARVAALSREPARESVLVLGHGPDDDGENARWLAALEDRAAPLRAAGYRRVRVETLREDWPDKRAAAIERIRTFVTESNRDGGTALVVPFRVQGFGPYAQVLEGLEYRADGQGLAPHPHVTRWLTEQAEALARQLGEREN